MTNIQFSDSELELLSQALGEAVAAQEGAVRTFAGEGRHMDDKPYKGILASLQARHRDLLALMGRVDNAE